MYYIIKSLLIALNWLILSIKIQGSSRHVSIAWCPVTKRVHDEKRCRGREKMAVEAIVPTEPWRPPRTTSRFRAILVWSSWKHPRGSKIIILYTHIRPNVYPSSNIYAQISTPNMSIRNHTVSHKNIIFSVIHGCSGEIRISGLTFSYKSAKISLEGIQQIHCIHLYGLIRLITSV